jgi:hypothetical protein
LTAFSIDNTHNEGTQPPQTLQYQKRATRDMVVRTMERGGSVRGRSSRQIAILVALCAVGICTLISPAVAQTWEPLFGPKTYFGTVKLTDVHKEPFLALPGHGTLSIKNGSDNGTRRVRVARISVNGRDVLGPAELTQDVNAIEVAIPLTANNVFSIELASSPGSYLTVAITQNTLIETALPEPVICQGPAWNSENPSLDSIVYSCQEVCANWQDCTYTVATEEDSSRCLLPHLAFVVDGMAGQLRWSCSGETTLFLHQGGAGTDWWVDPVRKAWRALEADGVRLVEIKWEFGVLTNDVTTSLPVPVGWFSRLDEHATTTRRLAGRPGALMRWMHDNLSNGHPYGTVGCSGGGTATYSPVYWYAEALAPIIDYQYVSGGGLPWDLQEICGSTPTSIGLCENDPLILCQTDATCGGGSNQCAFAPSVLNVAALIDYVLASGGSCQEQVPHLAYRANSLRFTPGNYEYEHLIDFQVGEGLANGEDDNEKGAVVAQGYVYRQLSGPRRWFDDEPFSHCQSTSDPALLPLTLNRIRHGLGLVL